MSVVVTLPLTFSARTVAAHPGHLERSRTPTDVDRRRRRHRDGEIDRRRIAAPPAIRRITSCSARMSTRPARSSTIDLDAVELAAVAARALDGFDRDLVARAAGDDDVARDIGDAEATISADPDLARETIGLFRVRASRGACKPAPCIAGNATVDLSVAEPRPAVGDLSAAGQHVTSRMQTAKAGNHVRRVLSRMIVRHSFA